MNPILWIATLVAIGAPVLPPPRADQSSEIAPAPRVRVRFVTDEADAALALLDQVRAGTTPTDAALAALQSSEGYRRLRQRELEMGRSFDEEAFRRFVLSSELAQQAPALARTLAQWTQVNLT